MHKLYGRGTRRWGWEETRRCRRLGRCRDEGWKACRDRLALAVEPVTLPPAGRREDYIWFTNVSLRWGDIDIFGHVNNARYYEFFDTAVLSFLHRGDIGIGTGATALVVAESGCRFLKEIVFTDRLEMGLRVERVGSSSVRYGLAVFLNGEAEPAADGHFVHVHVDPQSKRPAPLPDVLRGHLDVISVASARESPIRA